MRNISQMVQKSKTLKVAETGYRKYEIANSEGKVYQGLFNPESKLLQVSTPYSRHNQYGIDSYKMAVFTHYWKAQGYRVSFFNTKEEAKKQHHKMGRVQDVWYVLRKEK